MINGDSLKDVSWINKGAEENDVLLLDREIKHSLPISYRNFLKNANGFMLNNGCHVYAIDDVVERNQTLNVQEYAPGFLAIGDDSGGRSVLVCLASGEVFCVDQGSMDPDDMLKLSDSVEEWVASGCNFY